MTTSSTAIKDAILAAMATYPNIKETDQAVIDLVTCIAIGVYDELRNLDDNSGSPPSTGHS